MTAMSLKVNKDYEFPKDELIKELEKLVADTEENLNKMRVALDLLKSMVMKDA